MTSKELLKTILAHLKRTGELRYVWSGRVMKDKAFLWKLKHYERTPYEKTQKRIMQAIAAAERKAAGRG